jgi:hypothetical protein
MVRKMSVTVFYTSPILASRFLLSLNPLPNYENSRLCFPKGRSEHLNWSNPIIVRFTLCVIAKNKDVSHAEMGAKDN